MITLKVNVPGRHLQGQPSLISKVKEKHLAMESRVGTLESRHGDGRRWGTVHGAGCQGKFSRKSKVQSGISMDFLILGFSLANFARSSKLASTCNLIILNPVFLFLPLILVGSSSNPFLASNPSWLLWWSFAGQDFHSLSKLYSDILRWVELVEAFPYQVFSFLCFGPQQKHCINPSLPSQ